MANLYEVNTALCNVLGLDPKTTRAVNVKIRTNSFPVVTVQSMLREPKLVYETRRFFLYPIDPEPGVVEATSLGDKAEYFVRAEE